MVQMLVMAFDPRLQLDMTPDGRFRTPPRMPISTRIIAGAVVLAVLAGAVAFAAFALWIALMLIPVAIAAGLVAFVTIKFRLWQARRRAASFGGDQYVTRRP
jgi:hypothetical protein